MAEVGSVRDTNRDLARRRLLKMLRTHEESAASILDAGGGDSSQSTFGELTVNRARDHVAVTEKSCDLKRGRVLVDLARQTGPGPCDLKT